MQPSTQNRRKRERVAGTLVEIEDVTFRVLRLCLQIAGTRRPDPGERETLDEVVPSLRIRRGAR